MADELVELLDEIEESQVLLFEKEDLADGGAQLTRDTAEFARDRCHVANRFRLGMLSFHFGAFSFDLGTLSFRARSAASSLRTASDFSSLAFL